ncbi:MAG TPA: glycosyl hydrolase [Thermoleophilaceae bacterium]
MTVTRIALALAAVAVLALAAPAGAQERRVPLSFYGANLDGELAKASSDQRRWDESARMASSGVESVRVTFEWSSAQPRRGLPFDHTRSDKALLYAASHGLDVLPVVILAPAWARKYKNVGHSPPERNGDYTRYLRSLVQRYGPNGTFWLQNPQLLKRPIRAWQIWNEPHLQYQWSIPTGMDYAPSYGKLLRASYKALKAEDPGATVVLGGLSNFSWRELDHLYAKGGVKGSFDVAALHPYTSSAKGVVTLVKRFRIILRRHGDAHVPIWITELGLPASKGRDKSKSSLQTTDRGMAQFLWRSYKALAEGYGASLTRVERTYWYTWASLYCCEQFRYTGLLQFDPYKNEIAPKPAFDYYVKSARRDEGCEKDAAAQCLAAPPPSVP